MKRIFAVCAAMFPVLTVSAVVTFAQQSQPVQDNILWKQRVEQAQGAVPPPPGDFLFMSSEINFGGKVVKGAPYSAQAVTETVQTLGDGNRIVNKNTSTQYRDSEGRTRRELTIKMLGSLGDGSEPLQTIFINDPVAGVTYSLNSKTRTAHKSAPFRLMQKLPGAPLPPDGEGHRFEFRTEEAPTAGVIVKTPPSTASAPDATAKARAEYSFRIQTETGAAGATYQFRRKGPNDNEVTEQLGKQSVEGVEAEGTRTTVTIPAGEIGNERPIEIVSERWYSPELQLDVMTRHSDPRSGETTYRLTNIFRAEPAKSLFEVPADYTVSESFKVGPTIAPLPSRVRKQEQ